MRTCAVLIAAFALAGPAGAAVPHSFTGSLGDVGATLSWTQKNAYEAKNVRLVIVRGGETIYDSKILNTDGNPTNDTPVALHVSDLDADGQAEVIADLYTNGAHCCTYSLIERYDVARGDLVALRHAWGDLGYRLELLGGSAGLQLVSGDDRFAYAFACYACSGFPIQIWHYTPAGLVDVTSDYSALVRKDAARLWRRYTKTVRSRFPEVRGILAAWAADQALLGRSAAAFARLERIEQRGILNGDEPWPSGAVYLKKLEAFLRKTGYL
jgi:hypothetical protein